ncbi:MAG: transporter substrate-binding domain-containing protein [Anaerolineae bacterium]|nr:transporter substrate-binding domain-containing protein [Anaerolineae bacterium]
MPVNSALAEVRERGVLRVAVAYSPPPETGHPPEFYLDPTSGEPAGVLPELGKVMAADLGVKLELVDIPWPEHMQALLARHVDLLLSYTNTPARALEVEFAGPLLPSQAVVMVAKDSAVQQQETLNQPGRRIAIWHGSSIARVAAESFPVATLVESANPAEEVAAGGVDGAVVDAVTKIFLDKHPEVRLLRDPYGKLLVLAQEWGHPAVRLGDQRFLNWINNWLDYHRDGAIRYWCHTWWQSWMAG